MSLTTSSAQAVYALLTAWDTFTRDHPWVGSFRPVRRPHKAAQWVVTGTDDHLSPDEREPT